MRRCAGMPALRMKARLGVFACEDDGCSGVSRGLLAAEATFCAPRCVSLTAPRATSAVAGSASGDGDCTRRGTTIQAAPELSIKQVDAPHCAPGPTVPRPSSEDL